MSQRADDRQSLLLTAAGPAVYTTAWAFVEVGAGLDQPGAQFPAHLSAPPVSTRMTRHRNQALSIDHPQLAYRPHTNTDDLTTSAPSVLVPAHDDLTTTEPSVLGPAHDDLTTTEPSVLGPAHDDLTTTAPSAPDHVSDDLTTTAPSAPDRIHDYLTTTATTTATGIANVLDDNPEILFRHWHPAVPFPGAAVTGTAEAAKAAPC